MKKPLLITSMIGICVLLPANAAKTGSFETGFDKVAPYANMETLGKRLLHGLSFRQLRQDSAKKKIDLTKFSIDPRDERWQLFVPDNAAADGKYGVLVWLPDEPDFDMPADWETELSRQHIILVAPQNADEDRNFVFERAALGLLGLNGVINSYPVDAGRLYVGGHGSGAAVAEALALGYGDVFAGGILAGPVIPPGTETMPVPQPGIFERVAQRSRFHVMLPEDHEKSELEMFQHRMAENVCIPDVKAERMNGELPGAKMLANGLASMKPETRPSAAQCVLERRLAGKLALEEIQRLLDEEQPRQAIDMLLATHKSFGGAIDRQVFELSDYMQEEFRGAYLKAVENAQQSLRPTNAQSLENFQNTLPPNQRSPRGN